MNLKKEGNKSKKIQRVASLDSQSYSGGTKTKRTKQTKTPPLLHQTQRPESCLRESLL